MAKKQPVPHKYELYEASVQTPEVHVEFFLGVFREIRGKFARTLREDFCGTGWISAEWVKRNRSNSAMGVDLDPEPLAYGRKHHWSKLSAEQRKRMTFANENVLAITDQKFDVVLACNFSFYIFKKRRTLVDYFRACLRSLNKDGILVLEMAGGPGMIEKTRERRTVTLERPKGAGVYKFGYTWDQQSFDPITHDARYAIHFKLPTGEQMQEAFVYDWRLWTIPEVRDAMAEAGFPQSVVYWEAEHKGEGTGEYLAAAHGDNAYAWIAYIVGVK